MPTYVFKCPFCHKQFERILRLADYDKPQVCSCGETAERQICAPAVRGDYPPYECPVTGRIIEGRRAHEENLRRHGCRVLEPGEDREASRRAAASEAEFDKTVEDTVERLVANLPEEKVCKLETEIKAGVTATVERQ